MWRALLVFLALCVIAWCEFAYFPGHAYLQSSSQVYVAALEHLQHPTYLSRDLAATHPSFAFTVYDEVTLLFVNLTRLDLERILLTELFLSRLAGLFGLYLLARALRVQLWAAAFVAALLSLGTYLPGPEVWLFDPEPIPRALAFGPLMLSLGLLGRSRNLLAAFFAGCALLLDPLLAAPLWLALILIYLSNRDLRRALRPLAPVLVVFILLLANLAQLQQGTPDPTLQLTPLSSSIVRILQFRSPELWVNDSFYLYLGVLTLHIWALTRLWPKLTHQLRAILLMLPLVCTLTIPLSAVFADRLHLAAFLACAPLQLLVLPVLLMGVACAAAACNAVSQRRFAEGCIWAVPVLLVFLLAMGHSYRESPTPDTQPLAQWAQANTWGSSVFLFPDMPRSNAPGRFRAQSLRALWVDWASGELLHRDPALAPVWFRRWESTMQGPLNGAHLQQLLSLPIDYFVFSEKRLLEARTIAETNTVQPVFRDEHFAVYEASTLRVVPGALLIDGR